MQNNEDKFEYVKLRKSPKFGMWVDIESPKVPEESSIPSADCPWPIAKPASARQLDYKEAMPALLEPPTKGQTNGR